MTRLWLSLAHWERDGVKKGQGFGS